MSAGWIDNGIVYRSGLRIMFRDDRDRRVPKHWPQLDGGECPNLCPGGELAMPCGARTRLAIADWWRNRELDAYRIGLRDPLAWSREPAWSLPRGLLELREDAEKLRRLWGIEQ